MAVLPDRSVFGNAPSGLSGRPSADYTNAVAPGRQIVETAGKEGAGLVALGRGVEAASERAMTYLAERQEKEDRIALAEAKTTALLNASNLDETLKTETDSDHISKSYPEAYRSAFDASGANLSPTARQEYDLWSAEHVQRGFINANNRAHTITTDAGKARFDEDMDGLLKSSVKADIKDTGTFISSAKERVDAAIERGYIDRETGYKLLHRWSEDVRVGKIKQLPPEDRLAILGGVRPGTVAAADLSSTDKGILNAIAGPESGGKYDVRYGGTFSDFSRHPNVKVTIKEGPNAGKFSTAAGRYQFTYDTWDRVSTKTGLTDFSPSSQDKNALWLVKTEYQRHTGRSFDEDIKRNGGLTEGMLDVLSTAKGGPWEGFNSKAGKAKALAAYKATVSGKPEVGHSFEIADHPLVTDLSVDQRDRLANDAANDWARENNEKRLHIEASKANLNQRIADDKQSILKTGQPLDGLSLEEVEHVYGPEKAKQLDADRQVQKAFYTQTRDFDSIPTTELATRLDMLRPSDADAGKPGFKERVDLYKAAEADVKARVKERNLDPAAAVDRIPTVQEAKRKVDLGGDESAMRELARARMQGFDMLGIPESRRIPMTRQEAKDLAAPVMQALPGREREALAPLVTRLNNIYGDENTDRMLGFILQTARMDQETSEIAGKVFKQLGLGRKPNPADVAALGTAKTTGAMSSAAAGAPTETPKTYPTPTAADIRTLANNPTPQMVGMFNKHYGPGAGEKVMGELAKNLPNSGNKE